MSSNVKSVFEDKRYSGIENVFLFIVAFTDRATGNLYEVKLKTVPTIYSGWENHLMFNSCDVIGSRVFSYNFKMKIQNVRTIANRIFEHFEKRTCFFQSFICSIMLQKSKVDSGCSTTLMLLPTKVSIFSSNRL